MLSIPLVRSLIFGKGAKTTQRGKNSLFHKWCWDNWRFTCKRTKLYPYFMLYIQINSKSVIDLNVRAKAIRTLRRKQGILMTLDEAIISET